MALAWLPAGIYTGLIWFLSSNTIHLDVVDRVPLRDKGVHFVEYGLLGFLMAHAVYVTWPRARYAFLAALWLTAAFGLSDELHQAYVPGRSADLLDLLADTLGALCGIALYRGVRALIKRAPAPVAAQVERSNEEAP